MKLGEKLHISHWDWGRYSAQQHSRKITPRILTPFSELLPNLYYSPINKSENIFIFKSSLSNYSTFNISLGKQAYLCSINDFWVSRLKFLARTNYLPLNERLFRRSRIRSLLTYFCYGRCCLAILKMKIFSDFLIGE
jgi:hypothetical protein